MHDPYCDYIIFERNENENLLFASTTPHQCSINMLLFVDFYYYYYCGRLGEVKEAAFVDS